MGYAPLVRTLGYNVAFPPSYLSLALVSEGHVGLVDLVVALKYHYMIQDDALQKLWLLQVLAHHELEDEMHCIDIIVSWVHLLYH